MGLLCSQLQQDATHIVTCIVISARYLLHHRSWQFKQQQWGGYNMSRWLLPQWADRTMSTRVWGVEGVPSRICNGSRCHNNPIIHHQDDCCYSSCDPILYSPWEDVRNFWEICCYSGGSMGGPGGAMAPSNFLAPMHKHVHAYLCVCTRKCH